MPIIMCLYLITAGHLIIFFLYISTLAPLCSQPASTYVELKMLNLTNIYAEAATTIIHEGLVQLNEMETVSSVRCVVCCVRTYENNDLVMKNIMSKRAIIERR